MKFLMVNDEHELYRNMMRDLFTSDQYDVEEVPRLVIPKALRKLHDIHYSRKLNKFFEFPFKGIWNNFYPLKKYPFDKEETYIVLFMNGSLRTHYTRRYLENLKKKHSNVKLALLIFDQSSYYGAQRAIQLKSTFDYVFSFDPEDCKKYGFLRFYNCFSVPPDMKKSDEKSSSCFFAGNVGGREFMLPICKYLNNHLKKCKFVLTGVPDDLIDSISGIDYNEPITYRQEMEYAFNSNCLLEVVRENQTGITLRMCEAIAFNKKLLTNNVALKGMPFYDPRYVSIFSTIDDIDLGFLTTSISVRYEDNAFFSPIKILDKIMEIEKDGTNIICTE